MAFWNELPIVGGLAGAVFGNPEQEAHQRALKQAQQDMLRYRPEAMNARMNAMGSMSHAFDPMNGLMAQMYGPQSQMNMGQTIQNPFSQEEQTRMQQAAFPKQKQQQPAPSQFGTRRVS